MSESDAAAQNGSPRVRVAGILLRDNTILLVRHAKDGRAYWLLPGGGLEYGETLEQALIREFHEEAGMDVEVGDLVLVSDTIAPDGGRHTLNLHFLCSSEGEITRQGDDGIIEEVRFVPLTELSSLELRPDIRADLLRGVREGFERRRVYLGARWLD